MRFVNANLWRAIGAVVAGQFLVLGYMVWDRVSLLKHGREITLDVVPVDPRSLFRGDYVILNYDISRFPGEKLAGEIAHTGPVYVAITKDAAGKWQVVRAAADRKTASSGGELVLKGRLARWRETNPIRTAPVNIRYGIESFFVPEGTGKVLEKKVGETRIRAVIAVGRDGMAAIKGLEVDGQRVHSEPLI